MSKSMHNHVTQLKDIASYKIRPRLEAHIYAIQSKFLPEYEELVEHIIPEVEIFYPKDCNRKNLEIRNTLIKTKQIEFSNRIKFICAIEIRYSSYLLIRAFQTEHKIVWIVNEDIAENYDDLICKSLKQLDGVFYYYVHGV